MSTISYRVGGLGIDVSADPTRQIVNVHAVVSPKRRIIVELYNPDGTKVVVVCSPKWGPGRVNMRWKITEQDRAMDEVDLAGQRRMTGQ